MTDYRNIKKAMKKLETDGKSLFLAYDHGLEHGPSDLSGNNENPQNLFYWAEKGEFDGFICQKGIAEKYGDSYKTNIILKVNGKTTLGIKDDPYSPVICSVKRAVELNAKCIGFTFFPGSSYQSKMYEDFRKIQEDAHDFGLPVAAWMYPRGKAIKNDIDGKLLTYCARIGLEIGADMVKMKYNGNKDDFAKQVQTAGKTKVLLSGGPKHNSTKEFLQDVCDVTSVGAHGLAIGRNIWQHEKPIELSKAVRDVQIKGKDIYTALKRLEN